MALKDQLFISGVWTDADARGNNLSGTPLISAALNYTGQEIPDTYSLAISARAGTTGTVTVSASSNNPFNGRVITGVTMDDATVIKNVIPGVSLVFDNAAADGNIGEIIIGNPYGSFDASGIGAGVPTTGLRHRVLNDSVSDVSDAAVELRTQAIQVKMSGLALDMVDIFAEGATEKTAGGGSDRVMPYSLTISAVSGSGGSKIATLAVDGVALAAGTVNDLTTGTTVSGTGLKALGSTYPYTINSGPLTGLTFSIDPACANGDETNVLIFPSRYVQIAEDVAGVEGTYGTTPVDLTTVGETTGVIPASGVAYFWSRFVVPASANNESNPYPCNIAIVASESTSAGWEE